MRAGPCRRAPEMPLRDPALVTLQSLAALLTLAGLLLTAVAFMAPGTDPCAVALDSLPLYGLPLAALLLPARWLPAPRRELLPETLAQLLFAGLGLAVFVAWAPDLMAGVAGGSAGLFLAGRGLYLLGYRVTPAWRIYGAALNWFGSGFLLVAGLGFWFTS